MTRPLAMALALGAVVTIATVAADTTSARTNPNTTPGPPDTVVASWDVAGTQAFGAAAVSPAEANTIAAYVAIAAYDAVMAIRGGYEPFAIDVDAPGDASAEAAVAAASHRVLTHHLPAQAATILDPAYAASLADIPDGPAEDAGVETGRRVADLLIAERADDGFRAPVTYTPPSPPVPGAWIPTSPASPIGPYLGQMRPFALQSADQFRPDGPPALDSREFARDFQEVAAIGRNTSTTRTADQTLTARFWGEPPVAQARVSFRHFVLERELDIVQATRFMAMMSVTYADALIACFDAKYHEASWRPVTAIRAGHTDGNDSTTGDPTWTPLLGTPNHPEYPSAHSCITPASARVVSRFLHTPRIDFTVPSVTGLGDRHFATVDDLTSEVADARVWGGIHFRSAVDDGVVIAKEVTSYVLDRHFHPSGD